MRRTEVRGALQDDVGDSREPDTKEATKMSAGKRITLDAHDDVLVVPDVPVWNGTDGGAP